MAQDKQPVAGWQQATIVPCRTIYSDFDTPKVYRAKALRADKIIFDTQYFTCCNPPQEILPERKLILPSAE